MRFTHRGLDAVVAALGGGAAVRIVGGAVRDRLLGLDVSDVDLATPLAPDQVMERLNAGGIKVIPTGLAHGTVTAAVAGGPVEITTLRRDIATDGRHATVAFTDDWRADAARRDFTINALSADPDSGLVHDYFGGLADLAAGRVRFIGDPLERIAEDRLRILRFFRFHARFGSGDADPAALAACAARANDLMALSRERIASELLKLLATDAPQQTVAIMLEHGILRPVLPELTDHAGLDRLVAREHSLSVPGDPIRRLAALIGPAPDTARDIAKRLRLSKRQERRLVEACTPRRSMPVPALAYRIGSESALDVVLLGSGTAGDIAALAHWEKPALPISGGDLVARGLVPGPAVAQTLRAIEDRWVDSGFPAGADFTAIVDTALQACDASAKASASPAASGSE